MIERLLHESGFSVGCDTCSFFDEFEVGNNWEELISEMKDKGWRMKQNEYGEFEHYCPACVEEYIKERDLE